MMDQDDFPPPPPPQEAPDVFAEPALPLPNFNHAAQLLNNLSHTHNLTSVVMGIMANLQQELSVSCQGLAAHMQHVPNIPAVANANQLAFIAQGIQGLNTRFDGLENRFTAVENRLARVEERLDQGQQRHQEINQRLDQVNQRSDQVNQRLDQVNQHLDQVNQRLDQVITQENQRNHDINRRLDQMAAQVHDVDRRFDAVIERLDNVEGGLADVNRRLTTANRKVTDKLTNVNNNITNLDRDITTLSDKLSWEHQTANTRLLNSMTPLGPYRVIPHKPGRHDYGRRDFPTDLSKVHEMNNAQCGRLATAWDIDLNHLNQLDNTEQLNARKRCVARFMGLNL